VKALLDTSILVEAEREQFDLAQWAMDESAEVFICDAGIAEYLAGEPIKDAGKLKRFRDFWETVRRLPSLPLNRAVCEKAGQLLFLARKKGRTVPLGDGLVAAVADLEGLEVLTIDTPHFKDMGVPARNPLSENPPAQT
jgi:predicted nucleic acid-binding protein